MIAQVACYLLTTFPTATTRKPLKGEDENKVIDKDDERLITFGWALGSPNLASSLSPDNAVNRNRRRAQSPFSSQRE
jgi:hypothetical protein